MSGLKAVADRQSSAWYSRVVPGEAGESRSPPTNPWMSAPSLASKTTDCVTIAAGGADEDD